MSKKINLETKIEPVTGVSVKETPDSAVVLNLNNENYYGLNSSAFMIYQALTSKPCVAQAISELTNQLDIDEETLTKDTFELIEELAENGIVQVK